MRHGGFRDMVDVLVVGMFEGGGEQRREDAVGQKQTELSQLFAALLDQKDSKGAWSEVAYDCAQNKITSVKNGHF